MWINAWTGRRGLPIDRSNVHETAHLSTKRQEDEDESTCLPSEITSIAPDCAVSCIQSFVARSFDSPSCAISSSLAFLCQATSSSGYTIGEGGLQCLLESCATTQSATDMYYICGSIPDAQPKTKATITVTVSPSSTASNPLSSNVQIATVTPTQSSLIASDTSTPPDLGSYGFITADAPFPAPTTGVPNSSSNSRPGQMAGIAVGSAAGAFGLLGVMFFFCRRRRRQRGGRKTTRSPGSATHVPLPTSTNTSRSASPIPKVEDVIPRQAINPSPVESITAAMQAASAGVNTSTLAAVALSNNISASETKEQKTRSYWRKSIKPEEIGVAVTPTEENEFFRKSQGSYLTSNTRSMIPIPESAVLPTSSSPVTTIGAKPEQSGGNLRSKSKSRKGTPIQGYATDNQLYSSEKGFQDGDVEAQNNPSPTTQSSVLASARASLVGLGTMLRRSISLKRQPSDSKPLLKPTVYSAKPAQAANKYPLTPKYDNGNFDPNAPLTSRTIGQEPIQDAQPQAFTIPRKPTFSSFIAGKLLHANTFKSPPTTSNRDQVPPVPHLQPGSGLSATSEYDYQSSYGTASMDLATDALLSDKTFATPQALSDMRSPGMMPAPLTIRKSQSSKTIRNQPSSGATSKEMNYSPFPPLPANRGMSGLDNQNSTTPHTPRKAMELMGLSSPPDVHRYARKPLPVPSHPPDQFANLAPISEPRRLSALETLAAVKAKQHDEEEVENKEAEDFETPLSAATSWLSVPVSTRPNTTRVTMAQSPPSHVDPRSSNQTSDDTSPRGKPGFPSLAPSLSSIYTKYKYSTSQLPTISPTSAITLTAATYQPLAQSSQPIPPLPKASANSSFLRGPSPMPNSGTDNNHTSQALSSPDQAMTEVQSNLSSPQRFTRTINPYNPYFPSSPARQKSTSSSRSQSLALSSHPTPAVPGFAYPEPSTTSQEISELSQNAAAYFRTPSLRPTTPGRNGSRQPSSLFSPDSADPRRESAGFPKVVVTPNKLPGGDLVLTVDTTGKGYGA